MATANIYCLLCSRLIHHAVFQKRFGVIYNKRHIIRRGREKLYIRTLTEKNYSKFNTFSSKWFQRDELFFSLHHPRK